VKDILLFIVFPYAAFAAAVGVGLYRYFSERVDFTSRSSQILENRAEFWGSVPFHYAIITILIAHLISWIVPGAWQALLSEPVRRQVLEVAGMALGMAAFAGMTILFLRHAMSAKVRAHTRPSDWLVVLLLLLQIGLGVGMAISLRWGGLWSLDTAASWIRSLWAFDPQTATITALPLLAKVHFFNGFVIVAVFPFTRLIHIFTIPLDYLWRPWQVMLRMR
jgi:nitrate reductase gamma subunit